ncbi:MAG: hypothetical protein KC593_16965 [Myxococcales bacterium]|nr:hypothetical protein [Myxococcales bacterium]
MDPYRSAPEVRVIHTKLANLPQPVQQVLLDGLRKRDGAPPAIPLTPPGRVKFAALGLLLGFFAVAAYNIRSGAGGMLAADRALMVLALTTLAGALLVAGVVLTLRSMSLRLKPLAILHPEGWLICATGVGSNVDVIPLVSVAKVVPGSQKWLEVALKSGETLRYGLNFQTGMGGFFDAARAAVTAAEGRQPPDTSGIGKEVPRPSGVVPAALSAALGALLGLAAGLAAVVHNAQRQAEIMVMVVEHGLADAEEPDGSDTPDEARVRTLTYFFERTEEARAEGGLPAFFFMHMTDIAAQEERLRPLLAAAEVAANAEHAVEAQSAAETATSPAALRRLIDEHPDDTIGQTAREHLARLVTEARARQVAAGATPAELALCDWLARQGAAGESPALQVEVVRSASAGSMGFTEYPDAVAALDSGYQAVTADVGTGVTGAFRTTFGVPVRHEPGGATIRSEVVLFPGGDALVYTVTDQRTRIVRSSYTVPVLHARVRTVYTFGGESFEETTTHEALAQPMSERNMAEAYPTASLLYASEGRDISQRLTGTILRRLCLP